MPDAMIVVFTILLMYIIINETEDYLILLLIGLLFMLIGIDVINQASAGYYDKLFTAQVPTNTFVVNANGIGFMFGTIPVFAFVKVIIRRMQKKKAEQIVPVDD